MIYVLQNSNNGVNLVLQGPTGSGKSGILLQLYKHIIQDMKVSSNNVLVLLLNRIQSLEWRTKTFINASSTIWRTSYYGFVQSEISKYYPVIIENCPEITNKRIQPIFLQFEAAQFLISKAIEYRREKNKMLTGLTAYTDRIAIDLTSNIVKAATSEIPLDEIAERLYSSLGVEDKDKKQIFDDLGCILRDYKNKCMQLGVFDFGIAVDLYNKYLLNNKLYKQELLNRVHYIIVDNIEECVPTQIDLIKMFIDSKKKSICSHNTQGGYGKSFGANHLYMQQKILKNATIIETNNVYTCDKYMYEFSEMLFDNICNSARNKANNKVQVDMQPSVELRCEMLENIGEMVCNLIEKEGFMPSDITILSTNSDSVTEFVISRIIDRRGYQLKNLARNSRIIDNVFSQALITLAQLCHPSCNIVPSRDDIKCLISMVLQIDPIRSSILAGEICAQRPFARFPEVEFPRLVEKIGYHNIEKYEHIKKWIEDYKTMPEALPINEFLQKVFLEILISKNVSESDILQAKNLIDSARNFVESISKFNVNASKDFLTMVSRGVKASESIFELEEKLSGNFVIMSTPVSYLSTSLKHKVIILTSISSKNWYPRSVKEITNIHVLTKTWNVGDVYTEDLEKKNQKEYVAILIRSILKRCGQKLITFESNLSSDGYENEGILAKHFEDILGL